MARGLVPKTISPAKANGIQMNALDAIACVAEQKILEALKEGAFDNLPGAGRPLNLEEDAHIPPEWRMAHTLLKNSGFLEPAPAPLPKSAIREPRCAESAEAHVSLRRFSLMMSRVRRSRHTDPLPGIPLQESPYFSRLLASFGKPGQRRLTE